VCGDLRYVSLDAVDGQEAAYFDAKGTIVFAATSSDMGHSATYGQSPGCTRQPSEHLCGIKPGQHSE